MICDGTQDRIVIIEIVFVNRVTLLDFVRYDQSYSLFLIFSKALFYVVCCPVCCGPTEYHILSGASSDSVTLIIHYKNTPIQIY